MTAGKFGKKHYVTTEAPHHTVTYNPGQDCLPYDGSVVPDCSPRDPLILGNLQCNVCYINWMKIYINLFVPEDKYKSSRGFRKL